MIRTERLFLFGGAAQRSFNFLPFLVFLHLAQPLSFSSCDPLQSAVVLSRPIQLAVVLSLYLSLGQSLLCGPKK